MASFRSHRGVNAICLIIVVLGLCMRAVAAEFAGGTGEPNDPYQIATAEQLDSLSRRPEMWDKHFVLTADVDLVGRFYTNALLGQALDNSWSFNGTAFTGTFDGRGHVIARLTAMSDGAFMGLFGRIGPGASVRNLGVTDAQVRGRVPRIIRECGTGALAGENFGEVLSCYSTGAIYGTLEVGGLVGHNEGLILDCFSLADVIAEEAGGLVGVNASGSVLNCYAAGSVATSNPYSTGGLVAKNSASVANGYFLDPNEGGGRDNKTGRPLTRAQMRVQASFAGWDFLGSKSDGTREAWTMPAGGGYPMPSVFAGYEPVGLPGNGTASDPYLIQTTEHLGAVYARPRACYRLAADLDLSGVAWSAAPIPGLWGTLDGAGHTVSHLAVSQAGHAGLIGVIQAGAEVTNLALDQATITGPDNAWRCGGLAGVNQGKVASCRAAGIISGYGNLGGLVGWNDGFVSASFADCNVTGTYILGGLAGNNYKGTIDQCYATGRVTGDQIVGGFVGSNASVVRNSYSRAGVSGRTMIGGLVGSNQYLARISTCYASGPVIADADGTYVGGLAGHDAGRVIGGLWDTQASAMTWSAAGIGFATARMKTAEPYALNGWAGDPNWVQDQGHDYPHLAWEGTPGGPIPQPQIDWLDGAGTADDPYQIATPEQLCRLALAGILWDKQFVVTRDLDLTGVDYRPIGTGTLSAFNGVLDGKGHVIRGLTIHPAGSPISYLGLFGALGSNALVRDLAIQDANIVCTQGCYVGALAGWSQGTITNCSATGLLSIVAEGKYLGGLVGRNGGSLQGCHSAFKLSVGVGYMYTTGSTYVGGLVGWHEGLPCVECSSTGSVTVQDGSFIGGLIGYTTGQVVRCWADTPITVKLHSGDLGGLVGGVGASVSCSFARGDVIGGADSSYVGGLAGVSNFFAITDCYASGRVQGKDTLGGLLGYNGDYGQVHRCWASGQVIGGQNATRVGGLVGTSAVAIEDCYRLDPGSGGGPDNQIGEPLTQEQMMQQVSFTGWDFETVWSICERKDYPRLRWEKYSGGMGEPNDPYQIATAADLIALGETPEDYDKHFILTADIDLDPNLPGRKVFDRAVIAPDVNDLKYNFQGTAFTGTFDGGGHAIRNLTIADPNHDCLGLFGMVAAGGRVGNLALVDAEIAGGLRSINVGTLAGCNAGTLADCSATGIAIGCGNVRELAGYNTGSITNCHADVQVGWLCE